jgi:hypothetical protein
MNWTLSTVASVVCVAALAAGCAGTDHPAPRANSSPSTATTGPSGTAAAAHSLSPPPVPKGAAYLGAHINPKRQPGTAGPQAEQEAKAAFGRLGILHVFARWNASAPKPRLEGVRSAGAVPLLDWGCGPTDQIVNGREDGHIRSYAEELKRFGQPVFLRYAWEMNLATQQSQCASAAGPAGFVAGWNHIRQIFRDVGASNVAFVWCPGVGKPAGWDRYFPGADGVDWIGIDGYVRDANPAAAGTAFTRVFGSFYERFAATGKPMMVAETGALPGSQAAYLASLPTVLPKAFPQVKALVYFDAAGPRGDWSLQSDGLRALAGLAANPYFSFHA